MNGLKTDRRLLSPSIALIHICCLAERGTTATENQEGGGRAETEEDGGGVDRLRRLTADKAFCCLLMKVNLTRGVYNCCCIYRAEILLFLVSLCSLFGWLVDCFGCLLGLFVWVVFVCLYVCGCRWLYVTVYPFA